MNPARSIRSRATSLWRALSVLVVVAGAVTCDSPTSLGHRVSLSVAPVFGRLSLSGFSGMAVDSVRLTVVRPPSDTIARRTLAFSPDSASIQANITVDLNSSHEQLLVLIEFLSNSQVVFTGADTVDVVAGTTTPATAQVPISYVGPGKNVAALHITPRDSGAVFGSTVPFVITATDSSNANVSQFYVSWSTTRTGDTINAAGVFRPGATRGLAWVRAHTPSGIWDSARIAVAPVASQIAIVSGDHQSASVSQALPVPLVVQVKAADNLPVVGVPVQFAALSGGGSVSPGLVATDTAGKAATTVTLGGTNGVNTFTASVVGAPSITVTSSDTAVNLHGVPATITKISADTQTVAAGTAVQSRPEVQVKDAFGAVVQGASVQFTVQSGGGSVTGATVNTDALGLALVGSWTLGTTAGTNTLRASVPSVPAVTPVTFSATGKPFLTLAIVGSNIAGVGRTGLLAVKLSQADVVTDSVFVISDSAQYLLVTQPLLIFAPGDTLKTATDTGMAVGTAVVRAALVTTINLPPGIPPRYLAATPLVVPVTTNAIILPPTLNVPLAGTAPLPITLSSPAGATGVVIALFSTDTTKAKFTTSTVTVPASSTSVNATVQGVALGTATLVASNPGYAPGATSATVSSGPVIASTTLSPHFDTLTALTDTFALTAQARNATGGPLSGTFTWVSRDTTKVKVNAIGSVFAVANGSTYVVATEAGGTKDSAYVTVQQRLATINVTPGTRNIYLTRNFTFTAAAVDGRGFAMPGVTTFNWTTTAPAVASVDTSVHTAATIVTALGLGTAQVKATSGAVIGVANVSVLTPITRIAVVVDTVGAFKTDTFTLTSLGLTRRYRAMAHDTLDAVIPGDTIFNWVSTNGAVAVIDSTANAVHTTATSAANGVTDIRATAQGFTSAPSAYLTVAQVLASIELKPDTATIGIAGTMHMSARGKDANNRYISGGTFTYKSSTPGIATVDSVTGLVTGVSLGQDTVTAKSGAITSNQAFVLVSNSGPAIISFGRDTLSVGRGNQQAYPVLLSKPAASAMTILLAAPAFAHWQSAKVSIPLGQASVNAFLVGDSAGTTTVTATDSAGVYTAASAVAKVTANMRLTTSGYQVNVTDIVSTQVLLSDPSPAGGTYVTLNYSTPGIASVSPDPAFIPQGQLAADIQIHAVGTGSTNITPNAIGVNGASSSFTAYAPILTPSTTFIRLGQGQFEPNSFYVYTPTYTNLPVPVSVVSSDTSRVTVTPPVGTIPGGSYYTYFTTTAPGVGSATVSYTAPGWTASSAITVVGTTPDVGICCNQNLNTTSPQQGVTVYAEDSVRTAHYRVSSLVVRLHSTDTSVISVLDTVVTIGPGQYYNSSGRIIPAGLGGTAYVVATASGHRPDSSFYSVVGPKLNFSWFSNTLGEGQYEPNQYVYTPDNVTAPLIVGVVNSNPTAVTVPSADTIPQGTYYRYFNVVGNVPGAATFVASAAGYQPDTASYIVTSPRLVAGCCNYNFNNFGTGGGVYAYAADSVGSAHYRSTPLVVSVHSTDTTRVIVDSTTLTVAAGQYYTTTAHASPVSIGSAYIVFTAAGHLPDSVLITVQTPKLNLSWFSAMLGRRQHFDPNNNGLYVYTPDNRTTPLAVTITQKHGSVDSLTTTSPTIPAATYYTYFDAYGLANGVDTLIATAAGYVPDTAFITVTTPRFTSSGIPGSATTTNPPFGVNVYATDSVGNGHYVMDTLVVGAVSSDTLQIKPAQPFFQILKNTYYSSTTVNITGPTGTSPAASMTYSDSNFAVTGYLPTTTGTITVTGPSLFLAQGSTVFGMRQTDYPTSNYVYTQNNVVSPLVVHLLSTSTRVVTVPDSVIIPAGSYYAYFQPLAQDTVGTIQIQATATGYGPRSMNIQVTQPRFGISTTTQLNTTSPKNALYVYAQDANGTAHYTAENVTVTLQSSASSVASIDSATVTILTGNYYSNVANWSPGQIGTAQLSATDTRSAYYKYNQGTANVTVIQPSLSFNNYPGALGIGQYMDNVYPSTPDYAAAPISVAFTHTGTARTGTFANSTNTPITGVTIPATSYYAYFRLSGLVRGTDTLVASAASPAHNPATVYTVVDSGRVDPLGNWPSTINAGDSIQVTLYARDLNTTTHYVVAATQFALTPNANIEFHLGGSTVTSVTIPADQYFVNFYLKGLTAGAGSVTITNANYKAYTNTVTVQ